ncbi:MAG TPA: type II toxin-antitoxin system ParD family antitoxin [Caulobacteraceae bacterium]
MLTDRQQSIIEALVESGRYQNASEVLRDGLRMVERREAEDAAKLAALRAAADLGWRDADTGRYRDVEGADVGAYIGELAARAAERSRSSR